MSTNINLATAIALRNKLLFLFVEYSCFLSTPMNLWQVKVLIGQWGKKSKDLQSSEIWNQMLNSDS